MIAERVTYDGHDYLLVRAECCRVWEVALGFKIGRCGYCGQHPRIIQDEKPW